MQIEVCTIARYDGQAPSRCALRIARPKRHYKKRMRHSKLDPKRPATEPQTTVLSIVRRLAAIDPATFGEQRHSIVRRLLRHSVDARLHASMLINDFSGRCATCQVGLRSNVAWSRS